MKAQALLVSALLVSGHVVADEWRVVGSSAVVDTSTTIAVAVMFPLDRQCEYAELGIAGNSEIVAMNLTVDGASYGLFEAYYPADLLAVADLDDTAVGAMMGGRNGAVVTNKGTARFSLKGSRAAIQSAYDACMASRRARVESYLEPMQPSMPAGGVSF